MSRGAAKNPSRSISGVSSRTGSRMLPASSSVMPSASISMRLCRCSERSAPKQDWQRCAAPRNRQATRPRSRSATSSKSNSRQNTSRTSARCRCGKERTLHNRMVLASGVILLCALLASESVHAQSQQGQGGGQQQTPGPASPSGASFSGSITPSTNAGQGEATLLAAYEIRKWSIEHQSDLLKAIGDSERVVVFTGISAPNFSDWIQLDIQMMLAKKLLLAARANAEVAIEHAKAALPPPHAPTPPSGVHPQAVLGGVPAAAAALAPQFIQILQPFFTDWTVGSLTVNVDDYVLAISAASKIKGGGKSVSVSTHLFTNNVIDELVNCTEPKPDGQTCFSELARLAMSANNQINQIS